jgi:hypothetical protein
MAGRDGSVEPGPEARRRDVAQPAEVGTAVRRRRNGLLAGLVAVLVAVAIPVVLLELSGSDSGGHGPTGRGDATHVVLAAAGATAASGSYDITFTDHVTGPDDPGRCTAVAPATAANPGGNATDLCVSSGIRPRVDISGHGTVNLDPYASVSVTTVSGLGGITTYIDGTTVWEIGGGGYGATAGSPLSGFADSVEGTLGPGEGAVTMITLASRGGYLDLEEAAVQHATPAGTGTIDGATLTYYDITIDVAKLADAPGLTGEERATIAAALPLLRSAGYSGTEERIGIDTAGFIRDVTATERFADGSTMSRRTLLSNFGCAPIIAMPGQPAPAPTTGPCQSPDTTTVPTSSSTAPAAATTTTDATATTSSAATSTTSSKSSVATSSTSTAVPAPSTTSTTASTAP